ncbi:pilus (MSHA type) biogenesis protein MshL [Echinimonas agarilytica]|uniref:Pilus (MSHA type) biogenesis protein MshL n=1 Tax=Echinimonas agarilytica TaxID=1215918 RepID=A0AA42B6A8_9GAMM|nr:pilus (MSHA type) biogenesis protein MshL [Echinimonas agarilytica]MCM2678580.1 pilus (MSHA type) biogenesis protein MshL [Echinimonas agarilytica]
MTITKTKILIWFAATATLLAGCEATVKQPDDIQKEIETASEQIEQQVAKPPVLPSEVMQELMAPTTITERLSRSQVRFSIAADQVDAATFFASLVEGTPYSAAIHPDVTGAITLNLQQVSLQDALEVVQAMYGYDIRRTGNVLQVFPSKLRTETFSIDYLMLKRNGRSRTTINSSSLVDGDDNNDSSGSSSNRSNSSSSNRSSSSGSSSVDNAGTMIETESESDFWKELQSSVALMIGTGDGRAVISTPQSGLLTVRAMPAELAQVETFVNRLQNRVQRQVLLEAKILEVRLSDGYQQGIDWSAFGSSGFGAGSQSLAGAGFNPVTGNVTAGKGVPGNDIGNLIGGIFSIGYLSTDFNAVIDLLKTQGNVNVLSSPRISASNNQKAVIKVGSDEYFVTEVSATTVTGTSTSTTPEVELTPFFEGIALDVTPQIDDLGGILLHVHPSVTAISEQTKIISIFDQDLALPLAKSDIRETDTIVRANSGDVVVIGGLMNTLREQATSKVPVLGDIPLLGGLFTNVTEYEEKRELVIMLKPTIVETDYGLQSLKDSNSTIDSWYKDAQKRFDQ